MYRDKKIAVVVPAHNEELLIGKVITTMPEFVDRIIVVDDCSTDQTAAIVKEYLRTFPDKLLLVQHEHNSGVGKTITTGYKRALAEGMEIVAVMAGDAQMEPAELSRLLDPIVANEADYTKGNRLFSGDAWRLIPKYRYLGNAFLSLLTKIASGYWHVTDSQSGYTAISATALKTLRLDRLYPRYGYPNHLLTKLNVYDFRVQDIPITPVYNIGEKSGIKLKNVIPTISWLLIKCFFWRMKEKYIIRDFHPLIFFYLLGLLLLPLGVISGTYLFCYRIWVGPVELGVPLFSTFLTITGLQFLLFAMWFDMEHNKHLK
jgi:glycosyltransferase involved in cell wall biosynthesis